MEWFQNCVHRLSCWENVWYYYTIILNQWLNQYLDSYWSKMWCYSNGIVNKCVSLLASSYRLILPWYVAKIHVKYNSKFWRSECVFSWTDKSNITIRYSEAVTESKQKTVSNWFSTNYFFTTRCKQLFISSPTLQLLLCQAHNMSDYPHARQTDATDDATDRNHKSRNPAHRQESGVYRNCAFQQDNHHKYTHSLTLKTPPP